MYNTRPERDNEGYLSTFEKEQRQREMEYHEAHAFLDKTIDNELLIFSVGDGVCLGNKRGEMDIYRVIDVCTTVRQYNGNNEIIRTITLDMS